MEEQIVALVNISELRPEVLSILKIPTFCTFFVYIYCVNGENKDYCYYYFLDKSIV